MAISPDEARLIATSPQHLVLGMMIEKVPTEDQLLVLQDFARNYSDLMDEEGNTYIQREIAALRQFIG